MKKIGSALRDRSEWEHLVDPFSRNQKKLDMYHIFPPKRDGLCDCGCGVVLTGRRKRWASQECKENALYHFWIVKGKSDIVRRVLYEIDGGACRVCGVITDNWHADHIVPVSQGGGGCSIDNYQTLCIPCHKEKTKIDLTP